MSAFHIHIEMNRNDESKSALKLFATNQNKLHMAWIARVQHVFAVDGNDDVAALFLITKLFSVCSVLWTLP